MNELIDVLRLKAKVHYGESPLMTALANVVLSEPTGMSLLEGQGDASAEVRLHLLLALMHEHAISQPASQLARYFPSVGGSGSAADPALAAVAAAFLQSHAQELSDRMAKRPHIIRTTLRRSVMLKALAAQALKEIGEPSDYALIDIGCSIGVNLLLDRLDIATAEEGFALRVGEVRMDVARRGGSVPSFDLPRARTRIGIDIHRLDASRAEDHNEVLSHCPPENVADFEAARRVLNLLAEDPPELRVGRAEDEIAGAFAQIDSGLPVIVMHSMMINFLSPDERARLTAILEAEALRRPLARISMEIAGTSSNLSLATGQPLAGRMMGRAEFDGRWMSWTPFPAPARPATPAS